MLPIIEVNHLYKKYRIGEKQRYYSFRDSIADSTSRLIRRLAPRSPNVKSERSREFWALKDISFKVMPGEILGIIGRNGVGKSTLLKILSRITPPTKGEISLRGRVASLLEVGTGFHQELTGRENIYLNGAILGMKRSEINDKFDNIIEFAEISKFLDTPVKRYSSGMYMRLAFAIAAHLDPEILLVDEVLAVGDVEFQKKCLGKMKEINKQGRTVIFVSHNMNAIEQLCTKCTLLDNGSMKMIDNNVRNVIKMYLFGNKGVKNKSIWVNRNNEYNNQFFKPLKLFIGDEKGILSEMPVSNSAENWIYIEGYIKKQDRALTLGYAIYSEENILLYWSYQTDEKESLWIKIPKGNFVIRSMLPRRLLNEGKYRIDLIASLHFREWICNPGVTSPYIYFTIKGGLSDSPYWMIRRPGVLAPVNKWEIK